VTSPRRALLLPGIAKVFRQVTDAEREATDAEAAEGEARVTEVTATGP